MAGNMMDWTGSIWSESWEEITQENGKLLPQNVWTDVDSLTCGIEGVLGISVRGTCVFQIASGTCRRVASTIEVFRLGEE